MQAQAARIRSNMCSSDYIASCKTILCYISLLYHGGRIPHIVNSFINTIARVSYQALFHEW